MPKTSRKDPVVSLSKLYNDIEKFSSQDGLSPFHKELLRLLRQKKFLPAGGILGFGLKYKYTYSAVDAYLNGGEIRGMRGLLRTTDKILFALSQTCGLKGELKIVYKMKDYPGVSMLASTLSPFPNQGHPYPPTWENTDGCQGLCEKIGGDFIEISDEYSTVEPIIEIKWVSPILHINIMPEFIVKVEGEPVVSRVFGSYVLIMTVPKWSRGRAAGAAEVKNDVNPTGDLRAGEISEVGGSRKAGEIVGKSVKSVND